MKIYLARNNVQAGPYSLDELNAMLASQEVLFDDLMWHTGMSEWEKVGLMTGGQLYYQPQSPHAPAKPPLPQRGFGDNVDLIKEPEKKRVSVAELYGRKPDPTPTDAKPKVSISKPMPTDELVYASVMQRFLAFLINFGLYLLALMPLLIAFANIFDPNQLANSSDYASAYAYSQTLAEQIPQSTIIISNIMLFALLGIQLLLIIMRGQSFGKMVMGIRVVDENTKKLPSLGTLLFMRTIFLVTVYVIGMTLASGLPSIIMLGVNYFMAKNSPTSQGWHDKMTKTLVVKANPAQLDKTKK